jgi:hypothetical protein
MHIKMSPLTGYLTEAELSTELLARTGVGTVRTLRSWRSQRIGPPWANLGITIVYPVDGFQAWLRDQIQQPDRSHRAA